MPSDLIDRTIADLEDMRTFMLSTEYALPMVVYDDDAPELQDEKRVQQKESDELLSVLEKRIMEIRDANRDSLLELMTQNDDDLKQGAVAFQEAQAEVESVADRLAWIATGLEVVGGVVSMVA